MAAAAEAVADLEEAEAGAQAVEAEPVVDADKIPITELKQHTTYEEDINDQCRSSHGDCGIRTKCR